MSKRTAENVLNLFLIVTSSSLVILIIWNYFNQGWLSIQDYYLLGVSLFFVCLRFLHLFLRVNVFLFILLLVAAETLASFAVSHGPQSPKHIPHAIEAGNPYKYIKFSDDLLGFSGTPNGKVRVESRVGEQLLYDVVYSMDQYGRRNTPVTEEGERSKYILFFGGSVMFGNGVNDYETLAFFFASMVGNYMPYNYALGALGPQNTLAKLENEWIRDEIVEEEGIAVYVFIDDHVKRVVNTMRTNFAHRFPYYILNEEGQIVRNGNFREAKPLLYRLYHDILLKSNLLKKLNVDFPLSINEDHIQLTGKIIEAAKREYKRQFNNDNFFVLLHPSSSNVFGPILKQVLSKEGVSVLKLDDLMQWKDSYFIDAKFDLHPNAEGHRATAYALSRVIANLEREVRN